MNKKTKLILLSAIGMILLTSLIILLVINGNIARGDIMLIHDEEYLVDEIETIEIRSVNSDINIINTEEDSIRVVIYDVKNKRIEVTDRNGRLVIRNQHRTFCFIFCINTSHRNSRINVYVPEEFQGSISINTVSGDVDIENFVMNDVNVRTVSGDITIKEVNEADLYTVSGDIRINSVDQLNMRSVSGNLTVLNVFDYLIVQTTSGNVAITDAYLLNDSSIRTVSGTVLIDALNEVTVNARSTSGRVSIFENTRNSDIELDISTVSGNININ